MPDDVPDPALPKPYPAGRPAPSASASAAALSEADNGTNSVERVPLFPLLDVVLFPGAVLPLHVFENRYRAMTADALGLNVSKSPDGRKLVCMCRIRPGHDPMDDQPPLFEVACVGRIAHHEALPDGRYNFLLQGLRRVRLGREYPLGERGSEGGHDRKVYRRADIHPIRCDKAFEIDVGDARQRIRSLCARPPILGTPAGTHLEKLFHGSTPTVGLADVIAFDLIENPDDRQRLLEETDERRRVALLVELLDRQFPDPSSILPHGHRFDVDEA